MDIDEILINLKVLSEVQVHQKLITRGQYLNIEYVSIIPEFFRRWQRQDNRNETIKKITLVVHSAIEVIEKDKIKSINNMPNKNDTAIMTHNLLQSENESEPKLEQLSKLVDKKKSGYDIKIYLENSLSGLKALKETYGTCSQTCARLDVIINKIEEALK